MHMIHCHYSFPLSFFPSYTTAHVHTLHEVVKMVLAVLPLPPLPTYLANVLNPRQVKEEEEGDDRWDQVTGIKSRLIYMRHRSALHRPYIC
jgi:hypothetical protein